MFVRLPFPTRVPLVGALFFAGTLAFVQIIQGTDPFFALCCSAFILISVLGFNHAGGLSYPSGSYIFFFSTLAVLIGLVSKAVLGQAADTDLAQPRITILCYLGMISGLSLAAVIARIYRLKESVFQRILKKEDDASVINATWVTGFTLTFLLMFPHQSGGLLSALGQLNQFLPLAIVLGVTYNIRMSEGRSSLSAPVLTSLVFTFIFVGLINFSKAGLLYPFLFWLIPACVQRYRVHVLTLAVLGVSLYMINSYLVPYSQVARMDRSVTENQRENLNSALSDLSHVTDYKEEYKSFQEAEEGKGFGLYFRKPMGFLDRLHFISTDDTLIDYTIQNGQEGWWPVWASLVNVIPHVLLPNKPTLALGNLYAREIGSIISDDDDTTGISFSPAGEAYHILGWIGILVVAPILMTVTFVILDNLSGDVRHNPWGILIIAVLAHSAPEGGLLSNIYLDTTYVFGFVMLALLSSKVLPALGEILMGGKRKTGASGFKAANLNLPFSVRPSTILGDTGEQKR